MVQKSLEWLKTNKKPRLINFIAILALALFTTTQIFLTGCAVIRAPTGGPRDTIAPHLLGSIPSNYSRNFQGSEVILIFDEYLKIKDQATSVSISPEPEKQSEIKVKKKSIYIKFKSALEKNQTYSINFGNSIVDNNEGNILHNFKFVFSTGPKIDSLKISGHVSDPLDTTSKKDVYVILHKATKDSAIFKSKPLLYTSTDKDGNFEMANIAPGNYLLYALEEANKNKKYDNKTESIAFLDHPIQLKKDTSGIQLNLFKEKEDKLKVISKKIAGGLIKIELNLPTDSITYKLLSPVLKEKILVEKNARGDTSFIWLPKQDIDSVKFAVFENNKEKLKFTQLNFVKNKKASVITANDNISNGLLNPAKPYTVRFSEPLKELKSKQFILLEDSIPIQPDSIIVDSIKVRSYGIYYPWETKHKYQIQIKKNMVQSIYGGKNIEFKNAWTLGSERNYGNMILKIKVPKVSSYIVYLMDEQFKILNTKIITNSTSLVYKNLNPGKYRFRVIYDKNLNGSFDSGNLSKKIQPEKIVNSIEITIKSNFELNLPFNLPPK